jgi:ABC-type transport system involved in multi-copper enzyme maturation permease subunit
MSHPLLRKELRSLAPFLGLVLFFNLLSWAEPLVTKFPDQYPLAKLLSHDEGDQVLLFLVAFALASSLLVRERDDGTLAFLDALPISRTRIFFTKTALALGVLWLVPLSDLVQKATLYYWSRNSLEPAVQWPPLLTCALLDAASAFVFLSFGLALSFLRRFSLLVLGVLISAYLFLQEWQTPFVPLFNIFSLSDPVYQARRWLFPSTKLAVQLSLAVVCLGIALGAFQMMGDAARRFAERARRGRGVALIGGLAVALAVAVWIGLFVYWGEHNEGDNDTRATVKYANWRTGRARTAHYGFLYPENQGGLVSQLLDRADTVESRVRQFLGAQPIPWINADLTGSDPHTAGEAHWKQVQIDMTACDNVDDLTAVFAHETTHVYIDHESENRIADDFNATRFFHEGLASYVEHHLFRAPDKLARSRRVAAALHSRHEVKFDELMDGDALARKRDPDLVYPLGEMFVAALVQRYGETAPGKVVRAFGRTGGPTGLKGAELWRDVLQSWGGNLSEVEDVFFQLLDQSVTEQKEFIASLPRLRGAVQRDSNYIRIRATYEGPAPGKIVCRLRPDAETPERLYEYAVEKEPGLFRVNRAYFSERSFWYQLGWRSADASQPIYEPWVETTLN